MEEKAEKNTVERNAAGSVLDTDAPLSRRSVWADPVLLRTFGLDLRSLAALRVGLGALILVDLVWRCRFLEAHYSDRGILPRAALEYFSLYSLTESALATAIGSSIAALAALCLIVGFHTRFATALSWLLLVSLHLRNPLLVDSGDRLLALLLFWGFFLPLGACASVDARAGTHARSPKPASATSIFSLATLAYTVQLLAVYVFTGLLKHKGIWIVEGSATYYALNMDAIVTRWGRGLLAYPTFLVWVTRASFVLELFGPLFLFVPSRRGLFRFAAVLAFLVFHLGLAVSLDLVLFPYICCVAWLALLPGSIWEGVGRLRLLRWLASCGGAGLDALARLATAFPGAPRRAVDPSRIPGGAWAVMVCLVYVLWWNAISIFPALAMPEVLQRIGSQTRLRQRWAMFATPSRDDGWWSAPATLVNGRRVNLQPGIEGVERVKPELVSSTFPTPRLRKWLEFAIGEAHRDRIADYAAWLRYSWNREHGPQEQVASMEFYYMLERTLPPPREPVSADVLLYEWTPAAERVVSYAETVRFIDEALPAEE